MRDYFSPLYVERSKIKKMVVLLGRIRFVQQRSKNHEKAKNFIKLHERINVVPSLESLKLTESRDKTFTRKFC